MTITPGGVLVLSTPTTFSIAFDCSGSANFPNILLIMTRTSYESLTGPIIVNWTGGSTSFVKANFQAVNSEYVPPPTTTSFDNGRYTLTEVRENLGVNDTINDVIYYVFGFFLSGAVGRTAQMFEVVLPSENPRMLVLALARTYGSTSFDIRAFLPLDTIPEFGPILPVLVLTCTLIVIEVYVVSRFRARVS
jgi:hypothetical protein